MWSFRLALDGQWLANSSRVMLHRSSVCLALHTPARLLHSGTLQETADALRRAVGANGADPLGSIFFMAVPAGWLKAALKTYLLQLVAAECPSDMDRLPLDELDEVDQRRQPDTQRRGLQALRLAQSWIICPSACYRCDSALKRKEFCIFFWFHVKSAIYQRL